MANLIGENFNPEVIKQINIRQESLGNPNPTNEDHLVNNANTSWVRLVSSALLEEEGNSIIPIENTNVRVQGGDSLAKNLILFSGLANSPFEDIDGFKGGGLNLGGGGINTEYQLNSDSWTDFQYGLGESSRYGFSPPPGIERASIQSLNNGAIRKATVNIKCFNPDQFKLLELLYMRIGYPYLLEWGHTIYYDNNGDYTTRNNFNTPALEAWFKDGNNSYEDLETIYAAISTEASSTGYNYDGIIGILQNFQFQFLPDGSYNISLDFISRGAIIESLRANQVFNIKTNIDPSKVISSDYSYRSWSEIVALFFQGDKVIQDEPNINSAIEASFQNSNPLTNALGYVAYLQGVGFFPSNININNINDRSELVNKFAGLWDTQVKKLLNKQELDKLNNYGANLRPLNNDVGIEVAAADAFSSGLNFQLTRWINALRDPAKSGFQVVNQGDQDEYVYDSNNYNLVSLKFAFSFGENQEKKSDSAKQYYIKLGWLLQWIKTNLTRSQSNLSSLISIDTSNDNFMLSHPAQCSVDPRVCLIPYKNPTKNGDFTLKNELGLGFKPDQDNLYKGSVMDIHINIEHIAKILRQINKDGVISLYSLINNLLIDINLSIGSINTFKIVYIESSNIFKIYDDQAIPGINASGDKAIFQVYGINQGLGIGSFLEEFTFNSELFNSTMTSLAISATSTTTQGYNTSPFKSINDLTTNKFSPILVNTTTTESISVGEQLPELIKQVYKENLNPMYSDANDTTPRNYPGDLVVDGLKNTLNSILEYDLQNRASQGQTPDLGFIPLVTTSRMRGLGGIKIYQKFDIEPKEVIPSNYTTKFDFIIKTIDHEIANNKWTTSIGTMMYPKSKNNTDKRIFDTDREFITSTSQNTTSTTTQNPTSTSSETTGNYDQDVTRTIESSTRKDIINKYGWPIKVEQRGSKYYGIKIGTNNGKTVYALDPTYKNQWVTQFTYTYKDGTIFSKKLHQGLHEPLRNVLKQIEDAGFKGGIKNIDASLYARDTTNNPGVLSGHSFGVAMDFNSKVYGYGVDAFTQYQKDLKNPSSTNYQAAKAIEIVANSGLFNWGGNYKETKDTPHFTFEPFFT